MVALAIMAHSSAAAQSPAPPTASQNPSPMVEATRTHERRAPKALGFHLGTVAVVLLLLLDMTFKPGA